MKQLRGRKQNENGFNREMITSIHSELESSLSLHSNVSIDSMQMKEHR